MLIRKLTAGLCPLLCCLVICLLYRWLDGVMAAGLFWSYFLKGLLLGSGVALTLPAAGVRTFSTGLSPWLYLGAGILLALLLYQYLETTGVVHSQLLLTLLTINGQVVLVESAVMGHMAVTATLNRRP